MSVYTFEGLEFHPREVIGGYGATAFYPNGYGVSVIRGTYTYGGGQGLYELAVLQGTPEEFDLTYDTPITNDVIGHLTPAEVTVLMQRVADLPPANQEGGA